MKKRSGWWHAPSPRSTNGLRKRRQGSTVSQFLLDAALERAAEVTERATRISASRGAFENMMTALDQPARELPRLKRAAQHYKDVVHDSDPKAAT